MSILLLGATGQVGHELTRLLKPGQQLLTPTRKQLDLTDLNAVKAYLETHKPTLIINAAAYTAVDNAENDLAGARQLNAHLPELLAKYSQQNNQWLVHYSSDYVYNGKGETPWQETDEPEPLSTYGQTKLQGDLAIQANCEKHLIFRTSWVYSNHGHNFMNTMLRLGASKEELAIVADQWGAPTPASLIAEVTLQSIQSSREGTPKLPAGLYHLAPSGQTSWHGFAKAIFNQARLAELPVRIKTLKAITTAEYPTPAKRPLNSRLNTEKLQQSLQVQLPTWEETLEQSFATRNANFQTPS